MDERVERYAELAVRVSANVQPGQEVFISVGDQHVRHAMIEFGPDEALMTRALSFDLVL